MKYFNWIRDHKYQMMVTAFFIVVAILLYILFQGLQKDHSLDLVKQKLEQKEESRILLEQERASWEEVVKSKDDFIRTQLIKDSLIKASGLQLDARYNKLPNQLNEKNKAINSYGSNDLLDYFNNLPSQPANEY